MVQENVHKGRYKDMREYSAKLDWNNTLKNKTATECWNNWLRRRQMCPLEKKQGKRSMKIHLSKEAIRKVKYKQMMQKSYRHSGSEENYVIYKSTLQLKLEIQREAMNKNLFLI